MAHKRREAAYWQSAQNLEFVLLHQTDHEIRALYTKPQVLLNSIKSPSAAHQKSTRSSPGVQPESIKCSPGVHQEFN